MNQEFKVKTTITDIVESYDKNNQHFYKVWINWELGKSRIFYAFSTDFNLKTETLQLLTNSPERLTNQRVSITYQELPNKDGQGIFCRIKEIVI
jgi:hypothetical protein